MAGDNYRFTPDWVGYIGKTLIMLGMVLVFGSIGLVISRYACEWIFGINLTGIDYTQITPADTKIILALKVIQTIGGGIGMFLVPAFVFPKVIQYRVSDLIIWNIKPSAWQLLAALLMVVFSMPLASWFMDWNQGMRFPDDWMDIEKAIRSMEEQASKVTKVFVAANDLPTLFLNLFVVALVPAVCEEFFFRGVLLQYTRFVFNFEWPAIIVSALVFSGFHGQFYGFLPRFVMGILLGLLYMRTSNIWAPVLAHFLNNAFAVLMSYFSKELSGMRLFDENYHFDWYWVVLSFVMTALLMFALRKYQIRTLYKN
jgi:membrane protease YdiL (CAAX protease family)